MKKIVITKCPYCQSQDLTKGYATGLARLAMWTSWKDLFTGGTVEHTICKNCGSIVYSRVVGKIK